jgi:hypothetical protein
MTLDLADGTGTPVTPGVQFDVVLRGYDRAQVERYVSELGQQVRTLRQNLAEAEATTRTVRGEAAYAAVVARNQALAESDGVRREAEAEAEVIRERALTERAELLAEARRIAVALAEAGRSTNEARRAEAESARKRSEQAARKEAAQILGAARAELAGLTEQITVAAAQLTAHQDALREALAAHRAILDRHRRMHDDLVGMQGALETRAPAPGALPAVPSDT